MLDKDSIHPDLISFIDPSLWVDDKMILSAYIAEPRRLLDWRDKPLVPPKEGAFDYESLKAAYDDYSYLDSICQKLCTLPTIKGMVRTVPATAQTDLYQGFVEEFSWGGSYYNESDEIELNTSAAIPKGCNVDHMLIAHGAHELGHSRQNHMGCFEYEGTDEYKNSITAQLALSRCLEADATCFSIAVGYEYSIAYGDDGVLRGLCGFGRRASVMAYLEQIVKDPGSHEDGRAAQAAYDAYFSRANARLLKKYDLKICEAFSPEEKDFSRRSVIISTLSLTQNFKDSVGKINSMPFVNDAGEVMQRHHYSPTTNTDSLLKRVSRAARQAARFDGITIEI